MLSSYPSRTRLTHFSNTEEKGVVPVALYRRERWNSGINFIHPYLLTTRCDMSVVT